MVDNMKQRFALQTGSVMVWGTRPLVFRKIRSVLLDAEAIIRADGITIDTSDPKQAVILQAGVVSIDTEAVRLQLSPNERSLMITAEVVNVNMDSVRVLENGGSRILVLQADTIAIETDEHTDWYNARMSQFKLRFEYPLEAFKAFNAGEYENLRSSSWALY